MFNNIYSYNVFAEQIQGTVKTPDVNARCAVAIDSNSKVVLYEKTLMNWFQWQVQLR